MKLTVKDCLELNAFAGAEILAHEEGLTGNVSSVSVFDGADESDLNLYSSGKSEITSPVASSVPIKYPRNMFPNMECVSTSPIRFVATVIAAAIPIIALSDNLK